MSTSRVVRAALLAAVSALSSVACLQPSHRTLPPIPTPGERPERPVLSTIAVRLTAHEGLNELSVTGAAGGELSFQWVGASIRCSNGASRREFLIRPRARALVIGDRSYPGSLRVLLRPEGGLRAEVSLDLEEYVIGVVRGELPLHRAHPAELEVQAIAARTFALARCMERRSAGLAPFVWDDTRDQVYVPPEDSWSPNEAEARARLKAAVAETRGEVLVRRGRLFDSRYHAACGGTTSPLPSLPGSVAVTCLGCKEHTPSELEWSFTATPEELSEVAAAFGIGDRLVIMEPSRKYEGGRWREVHLIGNGGSRTVPVGVIRALLGAGRFASNHVLRTWPHPGDAIGNGLRIDGRGRGHGVGMCQEGAHELAERGWNRARILEHYYPGTSTQSWSTTTPPMRLEPTR